MIFARCFAIEDVRNVENFSSINIDRSGREASNTVFGDAVVATKHDIIGVQFQYNITTYDAISTTTTYATITQSNSKAVLATSTDSTITISATLQSKKALRYRSGKEGYFYFTSTFTTTTGSFKVGIADTLQYIGLFDADDGFYIGFNGLKFVVGKRRATVDLQIERDFFNRDILDGTGKSKFNIDFSKSNVFKISYGWLGSAPITFEVLTPQGKWVAFHVIEYPNTEISPSINNPVLPIRAYIAKTTTGTATDIQLRTSSWSAGIVNGASLSVGDRNFSTTAAKSVTAATTTNIMTLKNNATFQSKTNKIMIKVLSIGLSGDGTKIHRFGLRRNATVAGTPAFTSIRADASVASVDVAGTTVTGGETENFFYLNKVDAQSVDLNNLDIEIYPGESITLSVLTAGNSDVDAVLRWEEQF